MLKILQAVTCLALSQKVVKPVTAKWFSFDLSSFINHSLSWNGSQNNYWTGLVVRHMSGVFLGFRCYTILPSCRANSATIPSAQAVLGREWNDLNQCQPPAPSCSLVDPSLILMKIYPLGRSPVECSCKTQANVCLADDHDRDSMAKETLPFSEQGWWR